MFRYEIKHLKARKHAKNSFIIKGTILNNKMYVIPYELLVKEQWQRTLKTKKKKNVKR